MDLFNVVIRLLLLAQNIKNTHLYSTETDVKSDKITSRIHEFCETFHIHPLNCSCDVQPIVCAATNFQRSLNTTTEPVFERDATATVIYTTIAHVSSIFGVVGNAAVVVMAVHQRSKLSPCKLHVAQLAVVNLVFSTVQIFNVVPLYWSNEWIYGEPLCKMVKGTLEMGSLLSSGFFQVCRF